MPDLRESTDGGQQLLLGKTLLERGLITSEQLTEALAERARSMSSGAGKPLGVILVAKGYLSDTQLVTLLGEQSNRPPSSSSASMPSFAPPALPVAPASSGTRLGKYELLNELGRGGMGIVYQALDTQLNRKVALKLMLTNPTADAKTVAMEEERFVQEAQLSAKLKHPNIVTVYEAGVLEGRRFLSMELVDGKPLSDWRRETGAGLKQMVEILRDVALAVHHAHEQGILHRDLKPRNVLVGASNRPFVTDFGLAKSLGNPAGVSLTGSGAVVGTPSYMSPEQAQGSTRVDWRTDIWSLGVMLYEILTGRAPFTGESPVEILMKVVKDPVPLPSSVVEGGAALALDKGIETICMKALEKRDRDRYVTARAFAEDLARWLAGEQVKTGAPATAKRKAPKRTARIGAAAAVLLLLGGASGLVLWRSRPSVQADLVQARRFMELENYIEAAAAYSGVLKVDGSNKEALEGARRARELDAARKTKEEERLRFQLDASRHEAEEARKKVEEEAKNAEEAKTDEERQRAIRLKAEAEERARLADAAVRKADEQIRKTVMAVAPPPTENAWAKSTNLLSMVELPGCIASGTWTVQDNKLISGREAFARVMLPFMPPEEYDVRLQFSRLSGVGEVALLLPAGAERAFSVELGGWRNTSNGFQAYRGERRPDHFGTAKSARALDNHRLYTLEVQVRKEGVSATLDGRPLLSGSGTVGLTDLSLDACWALRARGFGLGSNASPAEFHRLDLLAVTGTGAGARPPAPPVFKSARISGRSMKPGLMGVYFHGTNFEVPALAQIDAAPAFSWNTGPAWKGGPLDAFSVRWKGYLLVPKRGRYSFQLASDDGSRLYIDDVQVIANWKVKPDPARSPFLEFEEGYHKVTVEYFEEAYDASVAISWADSPASVTSPIPAKLFFHDEAEVQAMPPLRVPEAVAVLPPHANFVTAAVFSPDAKFVVTASEDRKAKVWTVSSQREVFALVGHGQPVLCVAFSPDGKLIATGGFDNRIRLWDAVSGLEVKALEGHAGFVGAVAFSPDGKMLASGSVDRTVKLWDVGERSLLKILQGHGASVEGLAFSPDGSKIASASFDHTARIWEMAEGQEPKVLAGHADVVQGVCFSSDGATLATCGWDGLIKLWDPATGLEKKTLSGHTSEVMSVAFSRDGKLLASGGNDCMVRVWDPATGKEIRTLPGHTGRVTGISFAREGRLLVSASYDMTARLWDLKSCGP